MAPLVQNLSQIFGGATSFLLGEGAGRRREEKSAHTQRTPLEYGQFQIEDLDEGIHSKNYRVFREKWRENGWLGASV